jgi:myosin V
MQEGIEALIDCVVHRIGVVPGKPVAASTIFKCLLNWKSFEAEKTGVFDRLLQMFDSESQVVLFQLGVVKFVKMPISI